MFISRSSTPEGSALYSSHHESHQHPRFFAICHPPEWSLESHGADECRRRPPDGPLRGQPSGCRVPPLLPADASRNAHGLAGFLQRRGRSRAWTGRRDPALRPAGSSWQREVHPGARSSARRRESPRLGRRVDPPGGRLRPRAGQRLEEETVVGDWRPQHWARPDQDRLERDDAARGFILDGYPRQDEQLAEFEEMRREMGWEISWSWAWRSLGGGGRPPSGRARGRADDTPEVIRNRMEIHRQETEPVMDYFRSRGDTWASTAAEPSKISQRLHNALEERQSGNS